VSAGRCIRRDCVDGVGCTDEVGDGNDDVCPVGATAASGLNDGFASGLSLSLFSERRLDFLTEWMIDTSFLELLVSFLQISSLGAASTYILLSLPMLLSESSSKLLAS
jgi:hypothetical protein